MRTSRVGTWKSSSADAGRTARAFTLLELIVVLTVLGIAWALVFPRLGGLLLQEPEPWRSGRKLARLVRHARELAATTESAFVLFVDADSGDYWIARRQEGGASVSSRPAVDLRGRLGADVSLESVECLGQEWDRANRVVAQFSPDGGCDPVTLYLISPEGQTVRVVIGAGFDEVHVIGARSAG
ncbi:MAG: type II secretion system GspH family protein [Planctomycetes bacterium]|jgi:prepilin-type N-terminal cleavage/methylation domain-containing protein|nr:type II secretion system GspH family protein [Planctomycetota bacterium]